MRVIAAFWFNFRHKCIGIPVAGLINSFAADIFKFRSVLAVEAIAAVAHQHACEAFAVSMTTRKLWRYISMASEMSTKPKTVTQAPKNWSRERSRGGAGGMGIGFLWNLQFQATRLSAVAGTLGLLSGSDFRYGFPLPTPSRASVSAPSSFAAVFNTASVVRSRTDNQLSEGASKKVIIRY